MRGPITVSIFIVSLWLSACGGEADTTPTEAAALLPPPASPPPALSNQQPYPDVFFDDPGVNPFVDSEDDRYSTFALDVDTGSYTIARRFVHDGFRPDPDSIRVEEFVNYFEQDYAPPTLDTFAIHIDGAPTPYMQNDRNRVLRIGIQAMQVDEFERRDAALTFVIDTSGSMQREDRLELVKDSLGLLISELRASDTVAIVEYGSSARVVLNPTPANDRLTILRAIERLEPNGSTNAADGLQLGYRLASRALIEGGTNRVILCSDGVANVGVTGADGILQLIRDDADSGIQLLTLGFGMGNYNDVLMEQLANNGDGFYAYVDTFEEAERLFVHELTSTIETVAIDARIQVEFDPLTVESWRLIGFENRALNDEDFRNDATDAGEIGADHAVTALYEVKLNANALSEPSASIGTASLRWLDIDRRLPEELTVAVSTDDLSERFDLADPHFQLDIYVAQYAELLRESFWANQLHLTLDDLARDVRVLNELLPADPDVREFVRLVDRAADTDR